MKNQKNLKYKQKSISEKVSGKFPKNSKYFEEALKASERKYSDLFNSLRDAILVADTDRNIVDCNPAFEQFFGYSLEEIKGKKTRFVYENDEDFKNMGEYLKNHFGDPNFFYTVNYQKKSGEVFPGETNVFYLFDEKDNICGFIGLIRDVSERKKAEEEKDKLIHGMGERIKELNCIYNAANTINNSDSIDEILRKTADSIPPGWHYPEITRGKVIFDGKEYVSEPFSETQWKQQSDIIINGVKRGSVEVYYLEEKPELDEGPFVKEERDLINNLSQKVSWAIERIETVEQLIESETKLRQSQLIAGIGNFTWDIKTGEVKWSEGLHKLLKYDPEEEIDYDRVNRYICHPEDLGELTQWLNDAINSGKKKLPPNDYRLVCKDGEVKEVHAEGIIEYENDKPVKVFGTLLDITERKKNEIELRELNNELEKRVRERTIKLENSNKELEAFAYSVSHDLRAPLRHIGGFANLLEKKLADKLDEKEKHYMDTINESANKMSELIDHLLAFSRMSRSKLNKINIDTNRLVNDIVRELEPEISNRNINWNIDRLPEVYTDKMLLWQVFYNLISNAVKFTADRNPAEISIGCEENKDKFVFHISDNGIGFDMQYAEKLFGVFQRLHSDEDYEGTGIGLANVRRIIHRHGGRTWAVGEVDRGAAFYFSIPKAEDNNG